MMIAPSVSPRKQSIGSNNPAMRLYKFDTDTGQVGFKFNIEKILLKLFFCLFISNQIQKSHYPNSDSKSKA